jgi:hypothetical protein
VLGGVPGRLFRQQLRIGCCNGEGPAEKERRKGTMGGKLLVVVVVVVGGGPGL